MCPWQPALMRTAACRSKKGGNLVPTSKIIHEKLESYSSLPPPQGSFPPALLGSSKAEDLPLCSPWQKAVNLELKKGRSLFLGCRLPSASLHLFPLEQAERVCFEPALLRSHRTSWEASTHPSATSQPFSANYLLQTCMQILPTVRNVWKRICHPQGRSGASIPLHLCSPLLPSH